MKIMYKMDELLLKDASVSGPYKDLGLIGSEPEDNVVFLTNDTVGDLEVVFDEDRNVTKVTIDFNTERPVMSSKVVHLNVESCAVSLTDTESEELLSEGASKELNDVSGMIFKIKEPGVYQVVFELDETKLVGRVTMDYTVRESVII